MAKEPEKPEKSRAIADIVAILDGHAARDDSLGAELERITEEAERKLAASQTKSASPKPERSFWGYIDKAVLSLFEVLALLFALPFGDALFHDKPVTNLYVFYLVIGCLFAIGGPMFPLTRTVSWIPRGVAPSISAAARDARVWIVVLLLFFLYGVAPDIYRRATKPIAVTGAIGAMPIGTASIDEITALATKKIADERDEAIKSVARMAKERDDAIRNAGLASARNATAPPLVATASIPNLGRTSWSNLYNGLTQPGQLKQLSGWWIIVTAPPENAEAEKELSTLFMLSSNLSKTLSLAGLPDYSRDLDAPKLEGKALRGITVHGRNDAADFVAATLSNCFIVLRTAETPVGLFDYYHRQSSTTFPNDKFVWLEIGNESPWKGNCSG
jgi:hypothetical protein